MMMQQQQHQDLSGHVVLPAWLSSLTGGHWHPVFFGGGAERLLAVLVAMCSEGSTQVCWLSREPCAGHPDTHDTSMTAIRALFSCVVAIFVVLPTTCPSECL